MFDEKLNKNVENEIIKNEVKIECIYNRQKKKTKKFVANM